MNSNELKKAKKKFIRFFYIKKFIDLCRIFQQIKCILIMFRIYNPNELSLLFKPNATNIFIK